MLCSSTFPCPRSLKGVVPEAQLIAFNAEFITKKVKDIITEGLIHFGVFNLNVKGQMIFSVGK